MCLGYFYVGGLQRNWLLSGFITPPRWGSQRRKRRYRYCCEVIWSLSVKDWRLVIVMLMASQNTTMHRTCTAVLNNASNPHCNARNARLCTAWQKPFKKCIVITAVHIMNCNASSPLQCMLCTVMHTMHCSAQVCTVVHYSDIVTIVHMWSFRGRVHLISRRQHCGE